ncbi:MAG: restriction endonuclease subunit S [Lachnoclostridium sp.]
MDTKALRQKILDLAIRGKLVPQDPNDEPASVLLERIREQKQQMVKEGKLKKKDIKNDSVIFVGEDNLHYEKFQDGTVKCIEDEIPFELPEGWAWARIFSITEDLPYGTAKKSMQTGLVAVLRMGNIQSGEIDYSDLVYSSDIDDIAKYTLTKNDLLFNRTNSAEWVGKTAIYRGNIPAMYAGYLIRMRAFIDSEYLNVVMNSGYAKAYCNSVKTDGVNQSNINAQKLGNFLVPIPSPAEQKRISTNIVDLIPRISMIQREKEHIAELILQTKAKILDLAIHGKLVPQNPDDEPASVLLERIRAEKETLIKQGKIKRDKKESIIFKGEDNSYYEKIGDKIENIDDEIPFELPDGWGFVRLKELWELISGRDLSPSEYNADGVGVPYITGASNFVGGKVELVRWTTSPQVITEIGDLLLTCKGTIGEIAFNDFGSAHIARQIMAIRNKFTLNSKYLALCMGFYINAIKNAAKGLIPGISREDILNLILPVPALNYQAKVVERVVEVTNILNSLEKSLS